ncbi:hypothetical protein OGM63_16295 [Plectonema radiosum NIES-515]|uniref:Uncharacterized protein n=1 Tax=Plectonema radiosum NIES-515 TaxID=2986073 RepID=A0ABT3B106_9CYAN|nr:hypothetical protein [Plectonema radiosum]MCV3215053.1 hypothetical protein [Plectonema radiosum NIES-515]
MVVYHYNAKLAMPFRKDNKYCWEPEGEKALDSKPICFKLSSEAKEQLKAIPDWQKKLRDALPELIVQWSSEESGDSSSTNIPQ